MAAVPTVEEDQEDTLAPWQGSSIKSRQNVQQLYMSSSGRGKKIAAATVARGEGARKARIALGLAVRDQVLQLRRQRLHLADKVRSRHFVEDTAADPVYCLTTLLALAVAGAPQLQGAEGRQIAA